MTQPASCRTHNIPLWAAVLTLASMEDLVLTLVGVEGAAGAELNPVAELALAQGFLPAVLLKLASLAAAISLAIVLACVGHARRAERTLAFWSILYLALNAYSTYQLVGGFA